MIFVTRITEGFGTTCNADGVLVSHLLSAELNLTPWSGWIVANGMKNQSILCERRVGDWVGTAIDAAGNRSLSYDDGEPFLDASQTGVADVYSNVVRLRWSGSVTDYQHLTPCFIASQDTDGFSTCDVIVNMSVRVAAEVPDVVAHAQYCKSFGSGHSTTNQFVDRFLQKAYQYSLREGDYLPISVYDQGGDILGALLLGRKMGNQRFRASLYLCRSTAEVFPGMKLTRTVNWHEEEIEQHKQAEIAEVFSVL